jgi:hypothetical protein
VHTNLPLVQTGHRPTFLERLEKDAKKREQGSHVGSGGTAGMSTQANGDDALTASKRSKHDVKFVSAALLVSDQGVWIVRRIGGAGVACVIFRAY